MEYKVHIGDIHVGTIPHCLPHTDLLRGRRWCIIRGLILIYQHGVQIVITTTNGNNSQPTVNANQKKQHNHNTVIN